MYLYKELSTEDDIRNDEDFMHDMVNDGLEDFWRFGKRNFSSPADSLSVRIGERGMKYPGINLIRGVMTIQG